MRVTGYLSQSVCCINVRTLVHIPSLCVQCQVWATCVADTCNPRIVEAETGRLLRLADCQPNSKFYERSFQEGMRQRMVRTGYLASSFVPCMDAHRYMNPQQHSPLCDRKGHIILTAIANQNFLSLRQRILGNNDSLFYSE